VVLVRALDPGVSLVRLASVGSLAAGQVAALAEGILGGLGALHDRRLTHGSIHSGNVLVGADGRIRLCDAGLAQSERSVAPSQRQADLDDVALLLLEVWRGSRLSANPELASLLENSGLAQAVDTVGAFSALHDVWPESDRTAGRDGLGEFARRLAGESPPSPPPSSVVVAPRRAALPIPDMPNEPPRAIARGAIAAAANPDPIVAMARCCCGRRCCARHRRVRRRPYPSRSGGGPKG
jgi:serine/threonine protein kinase